MYAYLVDEAFYTVAVLAIAAWFIRPLLGPTKTSQLHPLGVYPSVQNATLPHEGLMTTPHFMIG